MYNDGGDARQAQPRRSELTFNSVSGPSARKRQSGRAAGFSLATFARAQLVTVSTPKGG